MDDRRTNLTGGEDRKTTRDQTKNRLNVCLCRKTHQMNVRLHLASLCSESACALQGMCTLQVSPALSRCFCFLLSLPLFWETSCYTTLHEPSALRSARNRQLEREKQLHGSERVLEVKASVEGTAQYPQCWSTRQSREAEPNLNKSSSKSFCLNTHHNPRRYSSKPSEI